LSNIIVLGSEGFIGNHIVKYFIAKGYNVSGCDLFEAPLHANYQYFKVSRLSPEWEEIFSGNQYDFCLNAAGSGNVPYSMTHPFIDFEANTLDTIRVLESIRRFGKTCKYLHISSAAVYGNPEKLPLSENSTCKPLSPYGWHKLMAEQVCNEYHNIYNVPVTLVRPFSVYGEGLKKQLMWDVCNKLRQSDNIQLFGSGYESRDFIHIDDLMLLLYCLVRNSSFQYEIYNAASGTESTIRSIAEIFEYHYQHKKKISFSGETRAGDPINWRADVQKAAGLGFQPAIDLKKGIGRYIEWFNTVVEQH
jgi:UDP-glucose 4-epimerase